MLVSLLMRSNVIGDDIESIIVRYAVWKAILSPSMINHSKGGDETSVRVIGASLI
jgi:hypothetical protein